MLRYTLNRMLLMIPTLLGVAVLVFFMLRIVPGDVVEVKLRGDGGNVSQEMIDMERKRLGLDKPLINQFADWMIGLATFDLGKSMWTDRPVTEEIGTPARTVAAGRDHGDHHRGADRDTARHDGGADARHLGRLRGADHHHRRPVDPVVLVRHADHARRCCRCSNGLINYRPALWVERSHAETLLQAGVAFALPAQILARCLIQMLYRRAGSFVGIQETRKLLTKIQVELCRPGEGGREDRASAEAGRNPAAPGR